MPGQTNNDIVIDALNQTIVAINEIVSGLPPGTDLSTVEANIALLAGYADDIRVAIETEAVAAITAQNTNFSDLQTTIAALKLICSSQTVVTTQNFFTSTQGPVDPGGTVIPPPEPFEDLSYTPDQITDRRCVLSYAMVDDMREGLQWANDWQLDELTNITVLSMTGLWIALAAEYAAESLLFSEAIGATTTLASTLAKYMVENIGLLEFSTIIAAIDNRRDDLACALFGASDVITARSAFDDVLDNEGVDATNRAFVLIIFDNYYLNHLYYKKEGDDSLEVVYQIGGSDDCLGCNPVCDVRIPIGSLQSDDATTIVVASQLWGSPQFHAVKIFFSATPEFVLCTDTFMVDNVAVVSGSVTPQSPASWRIYYKTPTPGSSGDLYNSNNIPVDPVPGARAIVVKSGQAFTVSVDRTLE